MKHIAIDYRDWAQATIFLEGYFKMVEKWPDLISKAGTKDISRFKKLIERLNHPGLVKVKDIENIIPNG